MMVGKGIISMDVMIALLVGAGLLVAIFASWSMLGDRFVQDSSLDFMAQRASMAASMLMDSEGVPAYWNSTYGIPGLLAAGRIDLQKVSYLSGMDYASAKSAFGLGGYNFWLELRNSSGVIIEEGLSPSSTSTAVSVSRAGLLGNGTARLRFVVWR